MRWGLVGTGPWARSVHAPSLATQHGVDFAGVWGRDAARADAMAADYRTASFPSFEAMLSDVEALSFAVTPAAQAQLASQALQREVHLLLEKPVATDPAIAHALAARQSPQRSAFVFLTRLFDPERGTWLRSLIGGEYTHAQVKWATAALRPGSPYAESAWRQGVGIIWDLMPHVLSQVTLILGPVASGHARPWPEHHGVEVQLRHVGGATSDIRMTLLAKPNETAEWIRFSGPQGAARSPAARLDAVAAHRAAIAAIARGTSPKDPLLRAALLQSAPQATVVMSQLASELENPRGLTFHVQRRREPA
jgi:predicted dehydrogenase